ncbi:GGDEF domain-containing protein [Sulfurospirillum oryzae]|uniref:GGDEF domain-containing protein n=1 Tax=Sulfurospirillum oryzae TaxID=2976535 RepID=UPI0021E94102|nr:GGDEF domain-containing protein [Sulfurospirillum oryzae]
MQKNHYFILATIITLLYWVLDAYTNVSLYDSAFMDELLLKTPHTLPFIKVLTAGLLFTLSLTPLAFKQRVHKQTKAPLNEFEELQKVADILFSSLSTKINVIKSLEILEEALHLESSLLFIYNKDSLTLYNENDFIKAAFRSKEILPFHTNVTRSSVEEIAVACFIEKRALSQDNIKMENKHFTLFSFALQESRSEKPLGNLMLATSHPHFVEQNSAMIQKFNQMLTFALSVAAKKELLQNLHAQHSSTPTNQHFDIVLNIMNYLKLQEHIEHEFNRQKRYHTALTLVLIDITMLKNLTKIFPIEAIVTFKKDFIQLVKKNTREVDIFGKWTNDQFALLLPDVDFRAGQRVAQKLQAILEETKFARVGKISCCYGITSLSPKDTVGSFKARAENALVAASAKEGNAIEIKLQTTELNHNAF